MFSTAQYQQEDESISHSIHITTLLIGNKISDLL